MISSALIVHEFNGFVIHQRRSDGLINATAMCIAFGKDVSDWLKTEPTFELVAELAKYLGIPPKSNSASKPSLSAKTRVSKIYPTLVTIKRGAPENGGGTWIHQELKEELYDWLTQKPKKSKEAEVRDKLQRELGGSTEVTIPVGKIDLLTKTEIIEVKNASNCLSAIGQILIYGNYYPNCQKRIHLVGNANGILLRAFEKQCKNLGIIVTYESETKG